MDFHILISNNNKKNSDSLAGKVRFSLHAHTNGHVIMERCQSDESAAE